MNEINNKKGHEMKDFSVYKYGNGSWAVKLPYKTTCWATKKAAKENAKAMKKKLEGAK